MEFFNTYFLDIIKNKYADFNGRARRKEFWMFILVFFIIYIALAIVGAILGSIAGFLGAIVYIAIGLLCLAVIVPSIALTVRRMHDVNKSGWFMLIPFYNLYLEVTEGDKGDNQYGPDPKAGER